MRFVSIAAMTGLIAAGLLVNPGSALARQVDVPAKKNPVLDRVVSHTDRLADGSGIAQFGYSPKANALKPLKVIRKSPAGTMIDDFDMNSRGDMILCLKPKAGSGKPCRVVLYETGKPPRELSGSPNIPQGRLVFLSEDAQTAAWLEYDPNSGSLKDPLSYTVVRLSDGTSHTYTSQDVARVASSAPSHYWSWPTFSGGSVQLAYSDENLATKKFSTSIVTLTPTGSITVTRPDVLVNTDDGVAELGNPHDFGLAQPLMQIGNAFALVNADGTLTPVPGVIPDGTKGYPQSGGKVLLYRLDRTVHDVDAGDDWTACVSLMNVLTGATTPERCSPKFVGQKSHFAYDAKQAYELEPSWSRGNDQVAELYWEIPYGDVFTKDLYALRLDLTSGASKVIHRPA